MSAPQKNEDERVVATNRRARHDYHIEQSFECGISLLGSEVKSLRGGKGSLQDAYAQIRKGEVFLYGMNIPRYAQASMLNHEPERARKLLLHRYEIERLRAKMEQQGFTLIPLRVYFKSNKVKVELGLAKGKKKYDKRETI
ncbi:MAG: SsrA-binding protein SmpB, partial [Actinomycetota bacterium]